jgi:hypothetical protein
VADKASAFEWLFFFHQRISLPERLQLVAASLMLALTFASGFLWTRGRLFYAAAICAGMVSALFLASVSYSYAFAPVEAVVVKSSLLYRDAGTYYAKVKAEPIPAGEKVKLLAATQGGKWLKIETADGTMGYIPQGGVRTIGQL